MATERFKDRPPTHRTMYVVNNSSRNGVKPVQVCVHSTESQDLMGSWDDLEGLTNYFNNPASDASSHIGVDGDGHSYNWVGATRKAWTCLDANPFTLNIEFVGRAAQPESAWEDKQLKAGAKWAAYWAHRFDFPLYRGAVGNSHGVCYPKRKGVITHYDVTQAGFGSHTDPGPAFPMDRFLRLARYYHAAGWTLD